MMSRAERLRLAGVVAPIVRGGKARVLRTESGKVITTADLAEGLLNRERVELELTLGAARLVCKRCGKQLCEVIRRGKYDPKTGLCHRCMMTDRRSANERPPNAGAVCSIRNVLAGRKRSIRGLTFRYAVETARTA